MKFIKWFVLAVANFLMMILALLLAPMLPAFAIHRSVLPTWLSWFQTPDNDLDGDPGFQTEHAPFKGQQSGIKRYINRVFWLIRNPGYGFDVSVLGLSVKASVELDSRSTIPLGGSPAHSGWFYAQVADGSGFQFYWYHFWSPTRASRVNLGWKLWSAPGECQFVCTVSPWMTLTPTEDK